MMDRFPIDSYDQRTKRETSNSTEQRLHWPACVSECLRAYNQAIDDPRSDTQNNQITNQADASTKKTFGIDAMGMEHLRGQYDERVDKELTDLRGDIEKLRNELCTHNSITRSCVLRCNVTSPAVVAHAATALANELQTIYTQCTDYYEEMKACMFDSRPKMKSDCTCGRDIGYHERKIDEYINADGLDDHIRLAKEICIYEDCEHRCWTNAWIKRCGETGNITRSLTHKISQTNGWKTQIYAFPPPECGAVLVGEQEDEDRYAAGGQQLRKAAGSIISINHAVCWFSTVIISVIISQHK